MSRASVTAQAMDNSCSYMAKSSHTYTCVDGRTYLAEKPLPSTEPDTKSLYKKFGHGFPSLIEVYRCIHYLSGRGLYHRSSIPKAEKERLVVQLALVFDSQKGRYTASHEDLWKYFQETFPEKLAEERITSYGELVYP